MDYKLRSDFFSLSASKPTEDDYHKMVVIGIQDGFSIAFKEKSLKEQLENHKYFFDKLGYILEEIKDNSELLPAIQPDFFYELATLRLQNPKINLCSLDDLKKMASLREGLNKTLVEAVSDDMKCPKEKKFASYKVVGDFYDVPDVLALVNPDDLEMKLGDGKVDTRAVSTVAKALKADSRFTSCLTPEDIKVTVEKIYKYYTHDKVAELYENIKHIAELENAFMEEYSDIIQLDEKITVAFNQAVNAQEDQSPQMKIIVGSNEFDSLQALNSNKNYKDSEAVMKTTLTMEYLSRGAALPKFAESLRMSSNEDQLATMAKAQLDGLSKVAP